MGKLSLYGEEIESIFELLGYKENSLTYSLGWILANNDHLLKLIVNAVSDKKYKCKDNIVRLQEFGKESGFTDIELFVDNELFVIIEAKVGWNLPRKEQLQKYETRFKEHKLYRRKLVVISEHKKLRAKKELKKFKLNTPLRFISWAKIYSLIDKAHSKSNNYQKKILYEFKNYLPEVISMQDKDTNWVFCVALNQENWGNGLTPVDIVEKKKYYFFPIKGRWPKDPPNYVAFRYKGKLQSIHHVEKHEIVASPKDKIPQLTKKIFSKEPHYILKLGPGFSPKHEVKNGNIWSNGRVWFMLDTVFTCKTVKEAIDLSKQREK